MDSIAFKLYQGKGPSDTQADKGMSQACRAAGGHQQGIMGTTITIQYHPAPSHAQGRLVNTLHLCASTAVPAIRIARGTLGIVASQFSRGVLMTTAALRCIWGTWVHVSWREVHVRCPHLMAAVALGAIHNRKQLIATFAWVSRADPMWSRL